MAQHGTPLYSSLASDPDMVELVQTFVCDLQGRIDALRTAGDAGDWAEVRRLAHQLVGAGGGYGFGEISTAAAEVESGIRDGCPAEQIRAALDEMISLCLRACADPPPEACG